MSALPAFAQINPGLTESPFPTSAIVPAKSGTIIASQETNLSMAVTGSSGNALSYGSNFTFKPVRTGNVVVIAGVAASCTDSGGSNPSIGGQIKLSYGTGAAPANGAAQAGTAVSQNQVIGQQSRANTAAGEIFSGSAAWAVPISGLAVGTTYWLDAAYVAFASNDTLSGGYTSFIVIEY